MPEKSAENIYRNFRSRQLRQKKKFYNAVPRNFLPRPFGSARQRHSLPILHPPPSLPPFLSLFHSPSLSFILPLSLSFFLPLSLFFFLSLSLTIFSGQASTCDTLTNGPLLHILMLKSELERLHCNPPIDSLTHAQELTRELVRTLTIQPSPQSPQTSVTRLGNFFESSRCTFL